MPRPPPIVMLERLVNSAVHSQLDDAASLSALDGRCVQFIVRDTPIAVAISVQNTRLQITPGRTEQVDVTITGSVSAFVRLARATNPPADLLSGDIQIDGALDVATAFSDVFSAIEVDWEEQLSMVFGDTAAHAMFLFFGSLARWQSDSVKNLWRNLADYLAEESDLLADAQRVDEFCMAVRVLRDDVDRLSARFEALLSRRR